MVGECKSANQCKTALSSTDLLSAVALELVNDPTCSKITVQYTQACSSQYRITAVGSKISSVMLLKFLYR